MTVAGPDAFEFLQGQLSNDLGRLETAAEIPSAWCNPKGRVIWFGTVRSIEAGFRLSVPAEITDLILQRLTLFRFRSKVEFDILEEGVSVDPGSQIRDGYPYIGADQTEQFTPHMLNLDLLDAISFDKGCYTGQEIVARTHYKGATKRRTLRFESAAPVAAGDKVLLDGREIGTVLNVAGNDLLAVVPVAKADKDLQVDGSRLTRASIPYDV